MIAIELFQQILGLFFIAALGYILVKAKLLKTEDSRIISVLCIYIIMPFVILNAFQIEFSPGVFQGFFIALCLGVCMQILLFIALYFLKRYLHFTDVESISFMYMNTGNLVFPMVASLFGSEWIIYANAYLVVQTFFFWTHGQAVMSGQKGFNWKKMVTNMNLIATALGFVMFVCQVKFTGIAATTVKNIAGTIGPMSMLLVGLTMAGVEIKSIFAKKRIYLVVFSRLILGGLLGVALLRTAGSFLHFDNQQIILTIVLIGVSTPSASVIVQLAQLYDKDKEYCSSIHVLTTLLCVITMPIMVALLNM